LIDLFVPDKDEAALPRSFLFLYWLRDQMRNFKTIRLAERHSGRTALLGMVMLLSPSLAYAGPPGQLKGKSVVISWTETRQQRDVGESEFRSVNASHTMSIYVSDAGRVFSRQVNRTRRGEGGTDQVAGEGGGPFSIRTPLFSGQTMTVIGESRGGARRAVISFDAGFASCTAAASTGFEAGKSKIALSPITKKMVEIRSVTTNGASCSVQSGNVFGGPG
jgi:hypothetical protein